MIESAQEETARERRLRQKREATARWMAKPENRRQYNDRLVASRATEEGREAKRAAMAKWLANPENREKAREKSREAARRRAAAKRDAALCLGRVTL
jgi:hypothetical protein